MKRWHFWVGLIISAIFLIFALRGLQIEEIWFVIKSADLIWLLPSIPVYFAGVWLRVWRWKILLQPIKKFRIRDLFPSVSIGYMGNNIYPARAGELLRAVVLKREQETPISAALATIIIERIFDGIVLLGFILLNISSFTVIPGASEFRGIISAITLWSSVIFMSALFVFILAATFQEKSKKIFTWMIGKMAPVRMRAKAQSITSRFFHGLQSLSSLMDVLIILVLSTAIWIIETGFYWFVMNAFPFQVSFLSLMLMNGVLNLITIIPSSPGYIGIFEAPGIALLTALGIDPEMAASYTILLHATLWLPITVVGAIYFARIGLNWNEETKRARAGKDT